MTNNQQLAAHCRGVIANPQDHLDWVVDMARVALAAMTTPVDLPDGWVAVPREPSSEMLLASKRYKSKTKIPTGPGVYRAMIKSAPFIPLTAQIEPICATGGAEWVKVRERLPDDSRWCVVHTEYGCFLQCWGSQQGWLGDEISIPNCDVTHWMPLPAAPKS